MSQRTLRAGFNKTPRIGSWYLHGQQALFEVVALSPQDQTIEIQYEDGAIAELDEAGWRQLWLVPASEPKHYTQVWDMPSDDTSTDVPRQTFEDPLLFFEQNDS